MPRYKHIFILDNVNSEKFKQSARRPGRVRIPERERITHGERLSAQFQKIWDEKEKLRTARTAEGIATREGTYLSFTSQAGHDLVTKSLEDIRSGIRLLNISAVGDEDPQKQIRATVYVPSGKEGHFIRKISDYQDVAKFTPTGRPKNADLVNSIEDISIALLESLWTDKPESIPSDEPKWCEAWLNVNTKEQLEAEQIAAFLAIAGQIEIHHKENSIVFPERAVVLHTRHI